MFFPFLFMNSHSSAKGVSRGQFPASVPAETWKNGNRRQRASRAVLEAAEICGSWPVSSSLCTSGGMFVASATEENSGRGRGALEGQAPCEDRVCAHHKPTSKIPMIQGKKTQPDFASSPD